MKLLWLKWFYLESGGDTNEKRGVGLQWLDKLTWKVGWLALKNVVYLASCVFANWMPSSHLLLTYPARHLVSVRPLSVVHALELLEFEAAN